ncbi:S-layer homology domain-containing protein [Paenibacillus yanchengensis]|uniref:S-layer homology domain-containing protein n=1 Tax=Paenibacillus yanchengensis TaxID=2035833 RepID=A0ABW4YKT8_9BACL
MIAWQRTYPKIIGRLLASKKPWIAKLSMGYDDGTFKPNNIVTRAELAVILDRAGMINKGNF